MLGRIEGRRRRGWQRMRWLDGITSSMDMSLSKDPGVWWWTGKPGVLQSMGLQRLGNDWGLNWTELREHFPWEKGPGCTILIPTDPGRLVSGNESSWQCREHRRRGLDLWLGKILRRRKWQPTSVFLPAKFHGQRNLASYSRWICKWVGQNVVTESAHTGRDRGLRETLEAGIHPLQFSYRWGFPRDGDSKELENKAKENQNTAQEGKKIRSNRLPESEKPKLPNRYFIC